MTRDRISCGIVGRCLPAVMIATFSASLALTSPAAEHPEHPTAGAKKVGALDGKMFVGELVEKGKDQGDSDTLVFKNGKFVSTACIEYGFDEAAYTATEKEGAVSFTAEPVNPKSEKMSWKGVVKNDQVEATAIYTTGAGQTEYLFKGKLKPAKKAEHPEHPK